MTFLKISNLTVEYADRVALNNFSAEIRKQQIVALVGQNGSGKSTLIKVIAGNQDYKGEIIFSDQISRAELQIGYVPQKFETDLSLPITVGELLELSLQTCSHSRREKQELIQEALARVELSDQEKRILGSLSGGQLRRVLLARAIVHHPQLLLLDEVEAGLDAKSERSYFELIQKLAKDDKITIILASHNLDTVSEFADKIIEMPI